MGGTGAPVARMRLGVVVVANRGGAAEPGRHFQGGGQRVIRYQEDIYLTGPIYVCASSELEELASAKKVGAI